MTSSRTIGFALLGVGAVLLALVGSYYAYGAYATSKGNENLNTETERPGGASPIIAMALTATPAAAPTTPPRTAQTPIAPALPAPAAPAATQAPVPSATPAPVATLPAPSLTRTPSFQTPTPVPSATPTAAPTALPTVAPAEDGGFTHVPEPKPEDLTAQADRTNSGAVTVAFQRQPASRMMIPAVNLTSDIKELEIVYTGGAAVWENPKFIVGHIPTTAAPADPGQGWYFGHLESPIYGEGNIFQRLPELADKFGKALQNKTGEKFEIQLVAGGKLYTYQVYKTRFMHKDELVITDSGLQDITLVTCYPRYIYDHRLLVTAALISIQDIPPATAAAR